MTRRETFESIGDIWMKEVDMYSTVDDAVKMVVANKVDKVCQSGPAYLHPRPTRLCSSCTHQPEP